MVLGSSRPSSGAEGLVVITEHLLPAGHTRYPNAMGETTMYRLCRGWFS